MKKATPALLPLQHGQQAWLLVSATATVLPHFFFTPLWMAVTVSVMFALRLAMWRWRLPPLAPFILVLLTFGFGLAVFVEYRHFFGREPGIALLLALTFLKLFEARGRRDGVVLVLLCFFLQMALFLQNQSVATALATAATAVVTTATLSSLAHGSRSPAEMLRLSGQMMLEATPFMLLLFILFPRLSGPLWGLPSDAFSATTGLSDTMSPGSISHLSQSDAVAFRVKFEDGAPRQSQLYWRGPVLARFDGRTWRPAPSRTSPRLPYDTAGVVGVRYALTLEASDRPWLFALETPLELPPEGLMSADFRVLTKAPLRARSNFTLRSRPGLSLGQAEHPDILVESLALPGRYDPRARGLAETWRVAGGGNEAILARALEFFRQGRFVYTLDPPPLGEDEVDEFLFDTRRGFCEHFAGSFVFLMRAAGVPARVVTGYQGGDINPVDGYFTVRQSNAHAWAEVWLPGEGWRRVDPTAASAPARIEQGLSSAVMPGERLPLLMRLDQSWLRGLRWGWEAMANGWNQWVLGYNQERQNQLLRRIGLPDQYTMIAVLAGLIGAFMALLLAWTLRRRRAKDPALVAWENLSRKLAAADLAREPEEGPQDWRDRVSLARPALAGDMAAATALYIGQRYGAAPDPEQQRRLEMAVARIKI